MRLSNTEVLQHTAPLSGAGRRARDVHRRQAGVHRRDGRQLRAVLQSRVHQLSEVGHPGGTVRGTRVVAARAPCCTTCWAGSTSTASAATASSAPASIIRRSSRRSPTSSGAWRSTARSCSSRGAPRWPGCWPRSRRATCRTRFFINNGTDAIEGAIKLARLYTRRHTFISTLGGFHGKSMGSLSLMGKASFREPFQSGLQDVRFVPYGDADALEDELPTVRRGRDPCGRRGARAGAGRGGRRGAARRLPPARPRGSAPEYGALLIADEIQTGMGRTGQLWGVDHWDVVPDIMCLGKSLGGGVMPLSAFISSAKVWEVMIPNPIIHSTTFGGNPLACAAGLAAIEVTLEEDLPGQAAAKGEFLLRELAGLQRKYPQVLAERTRQGTADRDGVSGPGDRLAGGRRSCSSAACWWPAPTPRPRSSGSSRRWESRWSCSRRC